MSKPISSIYLQLYRHNNSHSYLQIYFQLLYIRIVIFPATRFIYSYITLSYNYSIYIFTAYFQHISGIGKCPTLGILDITKNSSHLVDHIPIMVGWCSMGTFNDPCISTVIRQRPARQPPPERGDQLLRLPTVEDVWQSLEAQEPRWSNCWEEPRQFPQLCMYIYIYKHIHSRYAHIIYIYTYIICIYTYMHILYIYIYM